MDWSFVRTFATMRRLLIVAVLSVIALVALVVLNLPTVKAATQGRSRTPDSVITDVNIIEPMSFIFAFSPSTVVITAGTTVGWRNDTGFTHTSTSDVTGTVTSWDSLGIAPGAAFTQTFTMPGTYTYHCAIHPYMMGSVTVIAPVIYMPLLYRPAVL